VHIYNLQATRLPASERVPHSLLPLASSNDVCDSERVLRVDDAHGQVIAIPGLVGLCRG
jgi:hypothetical protein